MPEMAAPKQYEAFADDVIGLAGVIGVDLLDRDPRINRPVAELTVGPEYQRVPPRVLRCVAEHDLGVRISQTRPGGHFVLEVV